MKAVGYPVMIDLGNDNGAIYSVYIDYDPIFTGRSIARYIDIAPLLRDYLNSEHVIIDWPEATGFTNGTAQLSAAVFIVTPVINSQGVVSIYITIDDPDPAITSSTIYVTADYNNECQTDFADNPYITSVFVRGLIDRRQICFFGVNQAQNSMIFQFVTNQKNYVRTSKGFIITPAGNHVVTPSGDSGSTQQVYHNNSVIYRATVDDVDSTVIRFNVIGYQSGELQDSLELQFAKNQCYRYALYGVNRSGGITHIICEGKPLESYKRTDWDIQTDYDRLSQVGRSVRRLSTTTTRRWRLNTGYMSEADAVHIDDLVNSPHIVLHDMETGRLFAVNSTDGTIEKKTNISNRRKPIEYTLTFEEARNEIRR